MPRFQKLYEKIIQNGNTKNIDFEDLKYLIEHLGFENVRIKGDHFIYTMEGVDELINLQPSKNKNAKPYQVDQIINIAKKYKL